MKNWNILLVNPRSLQIEEFIERLQERDLSVEKLQLVSGGDARGQIFDFRNEPILVGGLETMPEEGYDIAIIFNDIGGIEGIVSLLVKGGIPVLDASGSLPLGEANPLILPALHQDSPIELPRVASSPHGLTLAAGVSARLIHEAYGLTSMHISAVQGVSQTGSRRALDVLLDQCRATIGFQELDIEEFSRQIAFNAFHDQDEAAIQNRIHREIAYLLRPAACLCTVDLFWAPFFIGFVGTIRFQTEQEPDPAEVLLLLSKAGGFDLSRRKESPSALDAVNSDEILLGDLTKNDENPRLLTLRFSMDNLRKGLSTHLLETLELFE